MFSSGHRSKMRWAQGECHLCVSTLVNVPGRTPAILPDFSENSHVGGLERWGVRMNDVTRILSAIERGGCEGHGWTSATGLRGIVAAGRSEALP